MAEEVFWAARENEKKMEEKQKQALNFQKLCNFSERVDLEVAEGRCAGTQSPTIRKNDIDSIRT